MKLSSKTHYGLLACFILAKNYPENSVSASTLEKFVSVSGKYLEQIMRKLSKRNLVKASRGANGGYMLSKSPIETSVGEIVRALEDDIKIIDCVDKGGKCKCCPTSVVWKKLYEGINDTLDNMNLQQLLEGNI